MMRVIAVSLSVWSFSVAAQTVTDLTPSTGGMYEMKIDGRPYVAVTKAQADELIKALKENAVLKERLAKAEQDLKEYRSLTGSVEQLRKDQDALTGKYRTLAGDSVKLSESYSEAAGKLVGLNRDYGALVKDYDALTTKYRDAALRSAPRQPIDLGLGVVRAADSNRVVVMAGAGIPVFNVGLRAWVFGGQGAYGVMMGASF